MASRNQQCDRCLHKDVCRYIEVIEEIKEKYPFVGGVTCKYSVRRTAANTSNLEPNMENEEKQAEPEKKKPETPVNKDTKDSGKNNAEEEEPLTMMDLDIQKLNVPEIVEPFKKAGIKTIGDVYEYQKKLPLKGIKGVTEKMLSRLAFALGTFNQPPIKI